MLGEVADINRKPVNPEEKPSDGLMVVKTRLVEPNRNQPRKDFNEEELNELADSAKGVVSLRAQVDEHKVQTYRIKRDKAVENSGVNSRVEKYGLTYEKIKERFK